MKSIGAISEKVLARALEERRMKAKFCQHCLYEEDKDSGCEHHPCCIREILNEFQHG